MNIKAKITPVALAIALAAGFGLPAAVQASGGGSGPAVTYVAPGQIGEIVVNPYKIAPLTAVIKNGGYQLKDATVRVVPKQGGQEISYKVTDTLLRTHAGIPVFGLYPDYNNTVEVSYTTKVRNAALRKSSTASTRRLFIRRSTVRWLSITTCLKRKWSRLIRNSKTASI